MYHWHRWFLSVCESLELRMLTLPNTQSTLHTGMVSCWTKALARLPWAERHECPHVDEVWGYGMVWVQDARFSFCKGELVLPVYIILHIFWCDFSKSTCQVALPPLRSWAIRPGTVLWLSDLLAMPCHASANHWARSTSGGTIGAGATRSTGTLRRRPCGTMAPIFFHQFFTSFSGRKWAELDNIWMIIGDEIGWIGLLDDYRCHLLWLQKIDQISPVEFAVQVFSAPLIRRGQDATMPRPPMYI